MFHRAANRATWTGTSSFHQSKNDLWFEWKHLLTIPTSLVFKPNESLLCAATFPWQSCAFRQREMIRPIQVKEHLKEVKPILKMSACSLSLDIVCLFDLKLKHRPCRSTGWFISTLSDRPFMDFLALLHSKIGPFGCPHAILIPCWANTATVQTSFARQGWRRELLPPTPFYHFQELWPPFYLWVIKEPLCANYSFLRSEHL